MHREQSVLTKQYIYYRKFAMIFSLSKNRSTLMQKTVWLSSGLHLAHRLEREEVSLSGVALLVSTRKESNVQLEGSASHLLCAPWPCKIKKI